MSVLHFLSFLRNNSCVLPFNICASRNNDGSSVVTSDLNGRHGMSYCDCDDDCDGVERSVMRWHNNVYGVTVLLLLAVSLLSILSVVVSLSMDPASQSVSMRIEMASSLLIFILSLF